MAKNKLSLQDSCAALSRDMKDVRDKLMAKTVSVDIANANARLANVEMRGYGFQLKYSQ